MKNQNTSRSDWVYYVAIFGIMKINLTQFNTLSDSGKTRVVLEQGTNLKTRKEEGCIINLYALSDFYVEVWYAEGSLFWPENKHHIDRYEKIRFIMDQIFPTCTPNSNKSNNSTIAFAQVENNQIT